MLPDYQNQGFGKKILGFATQQSESHPISEGIGLDTENPDNLPLYEHLGYQIVETDHIHGLDMWTMFRPNTKDKAE